MTWKEFNLGSLFAFIAGIFPYDPAIDSPLGHRNLILIYVFVWGGQFAYGAYVVYKWRKISRAAGIKEKNPQDR